MKDWELAYKDYKNGMKYKEIAEKYGKSINTVKSWKSRYWNDITDTTDEVATEDKKVCTQKEKVAHKEEVAKEVKTSKAITELVESNELTEQQKTFCLLYLKYKFNQTKAYQDAFNCDYDSARANSARLIANDNISKQIKLLKLELRNNSFIDIQDIINEYQAQFSADITDYVTFGKKEIELMGMFGPVKDEQGKTIMKEVNYVDFNESSQLDGTLIKNVRMGKGGPVVELYDKQKAMDALIKYYGKNESEGTTEDKIDTLLDKITGEINGT